MARLGRAQPFKPKFRRPSVVGVANAITLAAPVAYQVVQRSGDTYGAGGTGGIAAAGTYTGSPTAIEASTDGSSWTTIANGSGTGTITGGNWSGTLAGVTAGQYTFSVRFANATSVTASTTPVGVGEVFVIAGQSNAEGALTNNQSYKDAAGNKPRGLTLSLFANDYAWKELADPTDSNSGQVDSVSSDSDAAGSYWPHLGRELAVNLGCPVAFVPCARSGTSLGDPAHTPNWAPAADHLDRTTLYGSMNYRIGQAGGVRAVLLHIGESDAGNGVTQANFLTYYQAFSAAVAADRGIKVVPCKLQTCTGLTGGQEANINNAYASAWSGDANTRPGPDLSVLTVDDTGGSGLHLKTDANGAAAGSLWWTALKAAYFTAPTGGGTAGSRLVGPSALVTPTSAAA